MIKGNEFVKMFSEVEEEEKLYSTGSEELDDLLERAFCEGYEFAQKEYSEENGHKVDLNEVGSHRGLGRSVVGGGLAGRVTKVGGKVGAAISAAGAYAGKKYADRLDKNGASDEDIVRKSGNAAGITAGITAAGALAGKKYGSKLVAGAKKGADMIKAGKANGTTGKAINEVAKKAAVKLGKGVMSKKGLGLAVAGTAVGLAARAGARENAKKRVDERAKIESNIYGE